MKTDKYEVVFSFNNADFERNVQTSMSTLEKLKNGLKFPDAEKGFQKITAATKGFSLQPIGDAIESIEKRFSKFGTFTGRIIENLADTVFNKFRAIPGMILDPIFEGGMKRAENLEQARFMLEGLLGKTEEGAKQLEDIMGAVQRSVKGTAYGLGDAARVASQLVASGIKDSGKMETVLRSIAGTAAMTGSSFDEIGHIFTTVSSNGKLMTEQIRQFSYRGLNVTAQLAKALNVTEAEISDMVSQGVIDFETFYTAMDEAFGEHAKDANETYAGSLANVQAALSRIGESFQTPKLERMKDVFNALIPMIDALHEKLKPFIDIINGVLDKGAEKTINFINKITELLGGTKKEVTEAVDSTAESVENAANTISRSTEEIEEMAQRVINHEFGDGEERRRQLEELGYSYEEVQNKVNELLNCSYRYDVAEKELITTTETATEKTDELTDSVEDLNKKRSLNILENFSLGFSHIVQGVKDFVDAFKSGVSNAFTGQGSTFIEAIEKISDKFREFTGNLILATSEKEGLERVFTFIFTVVRNIALIGLKVIEIILTIMNIGARIGRKILDFIGHLKLFNKEAEGTSRAARFFEALKGVFERVGESIKNFKDKLKDIAKKVKETEGYKKLTDAMTRLHDAIQKVFGILKELFGRIIDKIIEKMEKFGKGEGLKFSWMDVLVKVVDVLASGLATLINWMIEGGKKVKAFFGFFKDSETGKFKSFAQIVSDVKEKFKSFIDGFKGDGTGKFSKFVETLTGFKDKLKELLHLDGSETSVIGAIKSFFTFIKDTIGSKFENVPGILGKLKEGFSNFWESLKTGNIGEFLSQIKEIAGEKFDKFLSSLSKFKERLKEILNINGENTTVIDVIKGFFGFLKEIVGEKLGNVPGVIEKLKSAFSKLFQGLTKDNIFEFFGELKDLAGGKFGEFLEKLKTMKDRIKEILHLDGDSINAIDVIKGFFNFFKDLATGKSGSILDFFGRVKDGFLEFFTGIELEGSKTDILGGIQNKFSEAISGIGEFFAGIDVSGFVEGVKSFFSKVSEAFEGVDTEKVLNFLGKLGKTIAGIILFFSTLKTLKSFRENLDKAGGMFTGIKGFFEGMQTTIQKMAKDKMNMEKAKIFIAGIIAIVASIWVLSKIPKEDLTRAVETLVGLMAGMAGAMAIIAAMPAQSSAFKDVGAAFAGLGVGLILVTAALKVLGGMDIPELVQGGIAVVTLLLTMAGAARLAGGPKAAGTLIGLAAAVTLLLIPIKVISKMDPELVAQANKAIIDLCLGLAIAARVAGTVKAAAAFMGLAVAIDLIIPALMIVNSMMKKDAKDLFLSAGLLAGIMMALAGAIRLASSPVSSKGATNMLKMTVPLIAAIVGLKVLADVPMAQMAVSAGLLSGIVLALAGALKLAKGGGTGANNMLKMTVTLAVAIAGLAVLANMPMKGLIAGAACITGVLLTLVAAFKLCKGGSKGADNMLKLTVPLAVAIAGLAVLANMPMKGLIAGAACLVGVLGTLAGLAYVAKGAKEGAIVMLALTVPLAAAIIGLYFLAKQPWENLLAAAAALSGVFIGISVAISILSAVPFLAGLIAIGLLDLFIASVIVIVAVCGALFGKGGKFEGVMHDAIPVMTDLGDAIGGFIEKIMEHVGEGIATNIKQLGEALGDFGEHIGPFVEAARTIDGEVLAGIGRLSLALLEITGVEILDGIHQFFANQSSIEAFGQEIVSFAAYLQKYVEMTSTVTAESVQGSIDATTALGGLFTIVKDAGIHGSILGLLQGNPLKHFGEELAAFGPSLYDYSTYATMISEESVQGSARAAIMLASMYSAVKDSGIHGGILGFLQGNPLKHFGEELAAFGPNLYLYAQNAEGVNEQAVTGSANAATMLAYMYKTVLESGIHGSILGFLQGNPLKHFGEELAAFGPGILTYSFYAAKVKPAAVAGSAIAGTVLAYMYKAVIDSGIKGGTEGWLQGNPLKHFGEELIAFAPNILTYSIYASKIKTSNIAEVNEVMSPLVETMGVVNSAEYKNVKDFGKALENFGEKLAGYYSKVEQINAIKITAAIGAVYKLIDVGNAMANVNTESMSDFGDALKNVGVNGIDAFMDTFSDPSIVSNAQGAVSDFIASAASATGSSTAEWYNAGVNAINGMINGMSSNAGTLYQSAYNIAQSAAAAARTALIIRSPSRVMYEIGEYTIAGMVNGMADNMSNIVEQGKRAGEVVLESVAKPIQEIQNALDSNIELDPVITPVLDLSNIDAGAGRINSMIGGQISLGNVSAIRRLSSLNTVSSVNTDNSDVVDAIHGLKDDMGNVTFNVTVDGAENPEDFADRLVKAMKTKSRM